MALELRFDGDKSVNLVKLHTCSSLVNKKRTLHIVAENGFDVVFVKNDQISELFVDQNVVHKRDKNDVHKYIFVNKQLIVEDDFINKDFLEYRDEQTNNFVLLGARCTIKFCIEQSKLFVEKLLDFGESYTKYDLLRDVMPKLLVYFNGYLLQIINTEKIEYGRLEEARSQIDKLMLEKFNTIAQELGIKVLQFKILQFLSPLKSLAVHAVPIEILSAGNDVQHTPMQIGQQSATYNGNYVASNDSASKDMLALLDDKISILVDRSLDKIQLFLDSCMQQVESQLEQYAAVDDANTVD